MPMPDPERDPQSGPVTVSSGPLTATFRPDHGGRMTCLLHTELGDILVPTPNAVFASGVAPFDWPRSGAYPLFPYHNRLIGSAFTHEGRLHHVTPHPSLGSDAMHGPAHRRPWHVVSQTEDAISLAIDYVADDEWPFDFRATQNFHLGPDRLEITLTLANTGHQTMPGGMGWHPYFRIGYGREIIPGARREWPLDALSVPTGVSPVPRDPQCPLPDAIFTIHLSEWDTATAVTDGGARLTLSADPGLTHLAAHRMPTYACLEPVSHVAGALGFGENARMSAGLVTLTPGAAISASLRLAIAV